MRLYASAFASETYPHPALLKVVDGTAFLWRAELAGHPHDPERWRSLRAYAERIFPRPGTPLADWHVALAEAATGDSAALQARIAAIEEMVGAGRFPWGPAVPALLRGLACFAAGDYDGTIAAIEPMLPKRERIGGSRAQVDLVEATLLKAYIETGRHAEMQGLLRRRRPGPSPLPVAGHATVH